MSKIVDGAQVEWEVLDPNAEYEKMVSGPIPRLANLNKRKIGLYWNGKPDGDTLLKSIEDLLREQFKDIEILRFHSGFPLAPEVKKEIAEKSDAVIGATGD